MRRERAIRVGMAEDGVQLSAVWRIWLNGSDIYIAPRNATGAIKTSLHASGKFRHAFVTDEVAERFQPAGADRAFSKWGRPAPQVRGGTLLFQLLFPESELHPVRPTDQIASEVVWLPRPPSASSKADEGCSLAGQASVL